MDQWLWYLLLKNIFISADLHSSNPRVTYTFKMSNLHAQPLELGRRVISFEEGRKWFSAVLMLSDRVDMQWTLGHPVPSACGDSTPCPEALAGMRLLQKPQQLSRSTEFLE